MQKRGCLPRVNEQILHDALVLDDHLIVLPSDGEKLSHRGVNPLKLKARKLVEDVHVGVVEQRFCGLGREESLDLAAAQEETLEAFQLDLN